MASPITYKRLVLSGDKAKETADEVKAKMAKDWKRDFPDGKLDIKSGVEGKMVIDVTTKDSSAASLASKIKDVATRNKVTTVLKDKPTLKPSNTSTTSVTSSSEKIKKDPKDMTDDELRSKLKFFGKKKDDEDDGDYDKSTIQKLLKTVGDTVTSATDVRENNPKKPEISDEELMKKIKSSLTYQVTGGKKGKPGLKENLDRRLAAIFLKYKDKSFPMNYRAGSMFAKFIDDLERSGAFNSDDEVSDFMSSEEFDNYANKFNVNIDYADYDPTPLELSPKEPITPQDMIPGKAPVDFVDNNLPHRVTDLLEKFKKTGKLKKSELKEIIKYTRK